MQLQIYVMSSAKAPNPNDSTTDTTVQFSVLTATKKPLANLACMFFSTKRKLIFPRGEIRQDACCDQTQDLPTLEIVHLLNLINIGVH